MHSLLGHAENLQQLKVRPKKTSKYLEFYQHYYRKIHAMHTDLTPIELTIIIKTIWKERKARLAK
jgi:deoxyadenosine/deoxycytidine kinase